MIFPSMRKALLTGVMSVCAAACLAASAQATTYLADSFNLGDSADSNYDWGAVDEGWIYTPTSSYSLEGISTEFSIPKLTYIEDRPVTVAVYENGTPTDGGVLLGSFTFDSSLADGTLGGGSFSTPISIVAGDTYFIGFENIGPLSSIPNVDDLGVNVTSAPGATVIGADYFDGGGATFSSYGGDSGEFSSPILAFYAETPTVTSAAPEPSAWLLMIGGLGAVGLGLRRKGRTVAFAAPMAA